MPTFDEIFGWSGSIWTADVPDVGPASPDCSDGNVRAVISTCNTATAVPILRRRKAGVKDLMLFTRELAILLAAGIALDRALATLDRIVVDGPMRGLPGQVLDAVKGGASLADAFASRGDVFPPFCRGVGPAGRARGRDPGRAQVNLVQGRRLRGVQRHPEAFRHRPRRGFTPGRRRLAGLHAPCPETAAVCHVRSFRSGVRG